MRNESLTDGEFNILIDLHFKFDLSSVVSITNISHTSEEPINLTCSPKILEPDCLKELINDKKKKSCWPYDRPLVLPSNLASPQQLECWERIFISLIFFYFKHINSCLTGC